MRQLLDAVPGLEFFPLVQPNTGSTGNGCHTTSAPCCPSICHPLNGLQSSAQKMALMAGLRGGRTIHRVLCDEFLQGHGSVYDEKWAPWIEPLLEHPLFKGVETLATEYAVCDKIKRVGGSFDFCCARQIPTISGLFWETSRRFPLKGGLQQTPRQLPSSRLTGASLRCITHRWW